MLAGMNEELDDDDVKEELIRCFSAAPTSIQVLKWMKQRAGENDRLYVARYKVILYRTKHLRADELTQKGEIMFYAGT